MQLVRVQGAGGVWGERAVINGGGSWEWIEKRGGWGGGARWGGEMGKGGGEGCGKGGVGDGQEGWGNAAE